MSGKEKPSGEVVLAPDGIEDTLGRVFLGVSPYISKLVSLPTRHASAEVTGRIFQMIENMERMMRQPEVLEVTGVSSTTIWRWVKSGDFPAPVKLGGLRTRSVAWRLSDVQEWLESRPVFDEHLTQ